MALPLKVFLTSGLQLRQISLHSRILLQRFEQSLGNKLIPGRVSMPGVGMHVPFSEGIDGSIDS
jgi:hypothetical protein